MKFLLIASFVALACASAIYRGNKTISVTEEGISIVTGTGKTVLISRPLGAPRNVQITLTGPNQIAKRIQVQDADVESYGEESRLKRGAKGLYPSQLDVLVEIFRESQGQVDNVLFERLLARVDKAVQKGAVSPVIFQVLVGLEQNDWDVLEQGQGPLPWWSINSLVQQQQPLAQLWRQQQALEQQQPILSQQVYGQILGQQQPITTQQVLGQILRQQQQGQQVLGQVLNQQQVGQLLGQGLGQQQVLGQVQQQLVQQQQLRNQLIQQEIENELVQQQVEQQLQQQGLIRSQQGLGQRTGGVSGLWSNNVLGSGRVWPIQGGVLGQQSLLRGYLFGQQGQQQYPWGQRQIVGGLNQINGLNYGVYGQQQQQPILGNVRIPQVVY